MSNHAIVPCIWLDDQAEQAADLYVRTFPGSRVTSMSRYPESGANPAGKPPGSVITAQVDLAGRRFTLLNGGPMFKPNPSISFFVHVDAAAEADRVFASLAEGGQVLMPIDTYPWSERYGWVMDRFGVSWQVMMGRRSPDGATIVPCLMFSGPQHRRAEEAMRLYTSLFPEGRITMLDRYGAGEGPEGTVKHARFLLAGQEMIAMDSHADHAFNFSEGISLQVMVDDQETLDRLWDGLVEGGSPSRCGWLKDRFGVSWQVVPARFGAWMTGPNGGRVFAAMMPMSKLDMATLERAAAGE